MGLSTPCATKLGLLLSYDPESGLLCWRRSARRGYEPGDVAGTVHRGRRQYTIVRLSGRGYYAHRLIWKIMTGKDATEFIDHADGDGLNNKWANLREASAFQNGQNRRLNSNNKSGVKGVFWETSHKSWRAVITANKKTTRLGRFKNIDDAERAIAAARTQSHGEFARMA